MAGLQEDARSAVATIEPSTGAVRGYYGGDEGLRLGLRFPPGCKPDRPSRSSDWPPQQGIPLRRELRIDTSNAAGWREVTNWDGNGCGVCSIATALEYSYNTSFIRLQDDLVNGTQDTADMGHALGVAKSFPGGGKKP